MLTLLLERGLKMNFYSYGDASKPVILLIPGTCCHHSIFDEVVPLLTDRCHVVVVSFSGFDETENTVYKDMDTETSFIESYVIKNFAGHIACCYGCSLGGSFVAYLVQRGIIRIDHAIIGSSDMDESHGLSAVVKSKLIAHFMTKWIYMGSLPNWLKKMNKKEIAKHPEKEAYLTKFMNMFLTPSLVGGKVKKKSVYNQFYSDLVTVIDKGIKRDGTTIHVFYAVKMGTQYAERYKAHFAEPDIRRHDMYHEELFACYPKKWVEEVFTCMFIQGKKK